MTKEGRTMKMTSYQNQYHNLDYKKGRNSPYYDLEYENILENNTLSIDSASIAMQVHLFLIITSATLIQCLMKWTQNLDLNLLFIWR